LEQKGSLLRNSNRQARKKGVEFFQVSKKEGFYENDYCKHSNIGISSARRLAFCSWFTYRYIANAFFRIFPPARFLSNALKGIEKLKALNEKVIDAKGNEIKGKKVGIVPRGDTGFNELLRVLKENIEIKAEIQRICLVEQQAVISRPGITPKVERFLVLESKGKQEILPTDPWDPNKPIRELKTWAEDNFRRQLAYWMLGTLGIWLALNSYMLYLLNK